MKKAVSLLHRKNSVGREIASAVLMLPDPASAGFSPVDGGGQIQFARKGGCTFDERSINRSGAPRSLTFDLRGRRLFGRRMQHTGALQGGKFDAYFMTFLETIKRV